MGIRPDEAGTLKLLTQRSNYAHWNGRYAVISRSPAYSCPCKFINHCSHLFWPQLRYIVGTAIGAGILRSLLGMDSSLCISFPRSLWDVLYSYPFYIVLLELEDNIVPSPQWHIFSYLL